MDTILRLMITYPAENLTRILMYRVPNMTARIIPTISVFVY